MPVKRPPTSKAAVRARQGDLGAKLELWVERLSALASGKEKLSFTHVLTLALVGALLIVTGGGVYTYMASRSVRLSVDDAAALKDVFLSGQPWLVECTAGSPSDVMYKAETRHAAPIKTALLDCGKKLPSGKTTIERFKLKTPGKGPFIIAVSNLELPVTAGWLPAILYDAVASPSALVKWSAAVTKPKVLSISMSSQLDKSCLKKKWCVVVLAAGSRLLDGERKALSAMAQSERGVRFVTVDRSKTELLLDIPGGITPPTAQVSTVLLLKQVPSTQRGSAAMVLERGLNDPQATVATLRDAMESEEEIPAAFTLLDKLPMLKAREIPKAQRPEPQSPVRDDGAGKTLTDEQLKVRRSPAPASAIEAHLVDHASRLLGLSVRLRLPDSSEKLKCNGASRWQQKKPMLETSWKSFAAVRKVSPFDDDGDQNEEEEEAEAMELED
ncbi:MAG: hypothetical protein SGPRY_004210 [Prymnesium sp.]